MEVNKYLLSTDFNIYDPIKVDQFNLKPKYFIYNIFFFFNNLSKNLAKYTKLELFNAYLL